MSPVPAPNPVTDADAILAPRSIAAQQASAFGATRSTNLIVPTATFVSPSWDRPLSLPAGYSIVDFFGTDDGVLCSVPGLHTALGGFFYQADALAGDVYSTIGATTTDQDSINIDQDSDQGVFPQALGRLAGNGIGVYMAVQFLVTEELPVVVYMQTYQLAGHDRTVNAGIGTIGININRLTGS